MTGAKEKSGQWWSFEVLSVLLHVQYKLHQDVDVKAPV